MNSRYYTLLLCSGLAAQTIEIASRFDTDAEGWSANTGGALYRNSGGNPGGYFFVDNPESDPVILIAPNKFRGDLRAFDGGILSFDGNMLRRGAPPDNRFWTDAEAAPYSGNYGTVTIRGTDGSTAKKDLEPGEPPQSWKNYTTPFTAEAFGVTFPQWLRILGSVSSITVSVEAIYGEEQEGFDNFIIRAMAPPLAITTASLPPGEVGQRYEAAVLATGGAPPYRFLVTGLPLGVDYDSAPPFIIGNPQRAGSYQVTITAIDSIGTNVSRTFPLEIAASTRRLRIDTTSLRTAEAGQPFSQTLQASGGAPPYRWEWDAVVAGLQIDPATGRIFGTPPSSVYPFSAELAVQVTVRDAAGATAQQQLTLGIGVKPVIAQPFSGLPAGQVGVKYDYGLFVLKGGQPPFRWDRVGTLPPGLTIDPATGRITGVPTTAGTFDFRVYVEDKFVQSDEKPFRIVIGTAPVTGVKLNRNEVACKSVTGGASATTGSVSVTGDPGQRVAYSTVGSAPWLSGEGIPAMVDVPVPATVFFRCDPTGLTPGEHRTEVRIGGQPVGVNFQVKPQNPKLQANPSTVDLTGPSKDIVVTLTDAAKSANVRVTVTAPPGVTVNDSSATVSVEQPLKLRVERAGPQPAGSQAGTVKIQAAGVPDVDVPVRVYGEGGGILELAPDIISFGPAPGPQNQSLYLINRSTRPADFSLRSDSPAVTASPATGTASAGTRVLVDVSKTGDLATGALLTLNSNNVTRIIPVQVTPPSPAGIEVLPTAIFFTQAASTGQVIRVTNVRGQSVPFNCAALPPVLTISPTTGTIPASSSVTISITGAATGTVPQQGTVTCAVAGGAATVSVVTIPPVQNCVPSQHIPRLINLSQNFVLTGGLGYPLRAEVRDNCGNPVTNAFVGLNSLDDDQYVTFNSLGDGQYWGSWHTGEGPFRGYLYAGTGPQGLTGRVGFYGEFLAAPPDLPVLDGDSPYHGASFEEYSSAAPGTYLTLIGKGLAASRVLASTIPLPGQLGDTSVLLAGRALPLHFVSPNQINVLVPYGLPRNTPLELVVRRGNNRTGTPAPLTLGDAAPGIFTINSTGKGPGIVLDQDFRLITETNPARVGRVGIVLATGLGDVTPALGDNEQTAADVRRTVLPVSVKVGGRQAQVLFSGLLPGFAGVYQVNFLFPEGATGDAATLDLGAGGHASNTVTVTVR